MVKRYVPDVEGEGYDFGDASPCMTEEADGDYVKAEDYDALAARLAEAERVCAQWCEWNEGLRNQLAEANQLLSSGCTAYDEKRLGKWMQDVAVFLSRHAVSAPVQESEKP